MMPYKSVYVKMFAFFLKKPMNERYGKEKTKEIWKKVPEIYREMLQKTDDIGEDNPMAHNIYMCFVFFAIWKAANGAIDVDELRDLTRIMMDNQLVIKIMGRNDINREKDLKGYEKQFHDIKKWSDEHPQYKDITWDFHFDPAKHKDGTYYYFTKCPLEKFARENGFLDVLPVMCDIDYKTAELVHGVLIRNETLATGGTMCDYWIVPDHIHDPK